MRSSLKEMKLNTEWNIGSKSGRATCPTGSRRSFYLPRPLPTTKVQLRIGFMALRVERQICGIFYARSASILATRCTLSLLDEKLCHQTIHFLMKMIGLAFKCGGRYDLPTMWRANITSYFRRLLSTM